MAMDDSKKNADPTETEMPLVTPLTLGEKAPLFHQDKTRFALQETLIGPLRLLGQNFGEELAKSVALPVIRFRQNTISLIGNEIRNPLRASAINFASGIRQLEREILGPMVSLKAAFKDFAEKFHRSISPTLFAITETVHAFQKNEKQMLKNMEKAGWIVIPHWPLRLYVDLAVDAGQDKRHSRATRLITEYYSSAEEENIWDHYDLWMHSKLFLPWKRHLKEAIEAHYERKYSLSIPTLLLVADGICAEAVDGSRNKKGKGTKFKQFAQAFGHRFPSREEKARLVNAFLADLVLTIPHGIKKKPRSGRLFRNGIFHGKLPKYNSKQNSCRALMLLDLIYSLLHEEPSPVSRRPR